MKDQRRNLGTDTAGASYCDLPFEPMMAGQRSGALGNFWLSPLIVALWLLVPLWLGETVANSADPQDSTIAASVVAMYRLDLEPLAATSCSASACHGGPRPGVVQPSAAGQSAYGLWLERDPHARSWQTICSDESVAMMTRLGILRGDQIVNQAGFDNCMACHNSHRSESASLTTVASTAALSSIHNHSLPQPIAEYRFPRHTEGVGCAGCHGPAEQWVNEHYLATWQPYAAVGRGFVPNDDLVTRARMCASCHVGDSDRDMNHDIIAAGHPALRFEMASHHSRLPKHWRDDQAGDLAAFEAKLWAAGAVASADAWLALQQGRAAGNTVVSTWPDFAANDCSSCHQSLRLNSDRDPLSDPNRRGAVKIARWDIGALQLWANAETDLSSNDQNAIAESLLRQLSSVQSSIEVMQSPDRLTFQKTSMDLRSSLPNWYRSHNGYPIRYSRPFQNPSMRSLPHPIIAPRLSDLLVRSARKDEATATWEAAAQLYLLLAASRYEWSQADGKQLHSLSKAMRRGLSLPPQIDSPRYSLTVPLGSELTRDQMRQLVDQVLDTLDSSQQPLRRLTKSTVHIPESIDFHKQPVSTKDASHASVR